MTLALNIFNVTKQVGDKGEIHEVSIDLIVRGHMTTSFLLDPLELCLITPSSLEYSLNPEVEYSYSLLNMAELCEVNRYAFLGKNETFSVVISSSLEGSQEAKLLALLRVHQNATGWTIADIKGISPLICTHRIYLEDDVRPSHQPQRRLNPHMKDVVWNEVLKLLDVRIIYPIMDSKWVSPTQVMPTKFGHIPKVHDKDFQRSRGEGGRGIYG
ncbi:hypothetical protein Acr_28g0002630 [Actinidia rufa]|uniref:Uncharacterized protein n=1 Tax=Actinidia rufa TaxID=165716 RepID=A0A7J0H970_9ERIC|nr:hypothetical protein Acr_28g0002630 [Actinidia rufa]